MDTASKDYEKATSSSKDTTKAVAKMSATGTELSEAMAVLVERLNDVS